jgi:hypothetical protein
VEHNLHHPFDTSKIISCQNPHRKAPEALQSRGDWGRWFQNHQNEMR